MAKNRKLTASLHTVTACTNMARFMLKVTKHVAGEWVANNASTYALTCDALQALGYAPEQYEGTETFGACLTAIAKIVRI